MRSQRCEPATSISPYTPSSLDTSPPRSGPTVIQTVGSHSIRTKEMEALFVAIGWRNLYDLGSEYQTQRLQLLHWACETLEALPPGSTNERLRQLALALPMHLAAAPQAQVAVR